MKRLEITIAPSVQKQIIDQTLYIARDSIDNALAWENRLRTEIQEIGSMPGHAVDEDASSRLGYSVRKAVFENTYLIHHWLDQSAGVVHVINFRHGARLPQRGEP